MQGLLGLVFTCYSKCFIGQPGFVSEGNEGLWTMNEVNRRGGTRHCKWCGIDKPDRCHHCRQCQRCVLKMDHHCPWVMNCIGFKSYKSFYLLCLYGVLLPIICARPLALSAGASIHQEMTTLNRYLLVLGTTLAFCVILVLGPFLAFHTWLVSRNMTTIEYCEARITTPGLAPKSIASYDVGLMQNIYEVFGTNLLLCLVPGSFPAVPRSSRRDDPEWMPQGGSTS